MNGSTPSIFTQRRFAPWFMAQVILVHLGTVAALPYFTWNLFWFAFGSAALFAYSMGIFHHMLLSHQSFECRPWLMRLGALFGSLTWRGPFAGPVRYVAIHKVHHAFSDTDADPHSPEQGVFHSLMGWFWNIADVFTRFEAYSGYAGKVAKDPWLKWMDRNVDLLQVLWAGVCFAGGLISARLSGIGWAESARFGGIVVLFGVFVKTAIVLYAANTVDLVNHTIGYRNYETGDRSTNSLIMFALHLGGAISWHNNHHAHQNYFSVRGRWWEIDAHLLVLRFFQLFGAVTSIRILDDLSRKETVPVEGL